MQREGARDVPGRRRTRRSGRSGATPVLLELLGDKQSFRADSLTMAGVTRTFTRVSDAAFENGLSRLYAGIHFRHAVRDGRRQGRSIGRVVAEALEPVR